MAFFNRVIVMGNTTRRPEVQFTAGGIAVTDVSLAINRHCTDGNTGQRIEETTFVEVTLWGRIAEIAAERLDKGHSVQIEGRLHQNEWDDKETGQKRSKLKVVGERIEILPQQDRHRNREGNALRRRIAALPSRRHQSKRMQLVTVPADDFEEGLL